MRITINLLLLLLVIRFQVNAQEGQRPNIILIMADDIGFSDIGAYGSEIETPNLDRLANEGLRFRTFYNMAKCNPTRSSMLTGLYKGGNGAVHLAQLTKEAGYQNIMSGKEHFDPWVPDYCRAPNVFDHSLYFWATTEYFLPPSGEFERPFYLEGNEISADQIEYEQSPMYKTDFITDYALKWMKEAMEKPDPFFLYLPYHSAHFPLQARPEDIEKYLGTYENGWEGIRETRFQKMKSMGLLSPSNLLSEPEPNRNELRGPLIPSYTQILQWDELTAREKDTVVLEMAVYAAMIDRMDQNIGRVIRELEAKNELDNTLIFFLSDNGSCPFYTNKIPNVLPGPANSYWSLRTTWANVSNTPFRQYKQCGHEGGSHTPFIAFWPKKIEPNTVTDQPGHIVDLLPTFLEILQINYPDSIAGYPTLPFHGNSLVKIFEGGSWEEPREFISGLDPFRMFRSGDFKITRMNSGPWELYDMENDPSETTNLANEFPDVINQLIIEYEILRKKWGMQ